MTGGTDPLVRVTVGRGDGREFTAYTRHAGRNIELLPIEGPLPDVRSGEQLALRRPTTDGDGYEEPVVVAGHSDGGAVLLELAGHRRRHQQRDHVRVDTPLLVMALREVVDEIATSAAGDGDRPRAPRRLDARVLDLSAGGARIEHVCPPLGVGTLWDVDTVLTYDDGSQLPVSQIAEVRWALDPNRNRRTTDDVASAENAEDAVAGLRFMGIRPGLEESVTRWVFQQQSKALRGRPGHP